jgi:hypothetical protein
MAKIYRPYVPEQEVAKLAKRQTATNADRSGCCRSVHAELACRNTIGALGDLHGTDGGESIMAELFLQISVSLDGYIENRDRDIEWMTSDSSFDALVTATLQSIDGMIFGRKAHALLADFWPTMNGYRLA